MDQLLGRPDPLTGALVRALDAPAAPRISALARRYGLSIRSVAAVAGYLDQAHLAREFRRYAGGTPTSFFGDDPALAIAILGGESR